EANASCIASSARSKDPEMPMRLAIIRPDSSRKTDSAARRVSSIQSRILDPGPRLGAGVLKSHRTNLDATRVSLTFGGYLSCPLDRLIQIRAIHDVVPGKMLLGFRERAIEDQGFAILH